MKPGIATRSLIVALAATAVTLLAAGCQKSEEVATTAELERFDVALDPPTNGNDVGITANHAGIYTALENGYFEDAGLDVRLQTPSDASGPIQQVAAGRVDLAVAYEPEVMLARDQALDVLAVAALIQEPLTSLISLPDADIAEPADLEGKRVVTTGIPYQTAYLDTILREAGVDPSSVKRTPVEGNLVEPLLKKDADASFGGFENAQGVELQLGGEDPLITPVNELRIPTYDEVVLVAQGERVADDSEAIRLFIAALERGARSAQANPQAAAAALIAAEPKLDPRLTRAAVDRTVPLFLPPAERPYGWMDPSEWVGFAGFLADQGQINQRLGTKELLTNELLPGEIPE